MSDDDLDRRIALHLRRGWAPARYRHLQPELRALIRQCGFRPGMKECFANAQRIMLDALGTPLAKRLRYHEGIVLSVGMPILHAWLTLDGAIQDPTLNKPASDYLASNTYSAAKIHRQMVLTKHWRPLDEAALHRLLLEAFRTPR